jgi:hypothetical protein
MSPPERMYETLPFSRDQRSPGLRPSSRRSMPWSIRPDQWAARFQSDRYLNPDQMLCIPWQSTDGMGRPISDQTYQTKQPGCNSALDRVDVENEQRPQNVDQIGLNAAGINQGGETCLTWTPRITCKGCYTQPDPMGYYNRQRRREQLLQINERAVQYKRDSGF